MAQQIAPGEEPKIAVKSAEPEAAPQGDVVTTNRTPAAPTYHAGDNHGTQENPGGEGADSHRESFGGLGKGIPTTPSVETDGDVVTHAPLKAPLVDNPAGVFHAGDDHAPTSSMAGTYRADPDRVTRDRKPTHEMNAVIEHHFENLRDKKYVENPTGSVSSVKTIIVEADGQYMVIPTIWDGKQLNKEQSFRRAIHSGKDWPKFDTIDEADAADAEWHKYMSAPYIEKDLAHLKYQFEGQPMPEHTDEQAGPLESQPMPQKKSERDQAIDGLGAAYDLRKRHDEMLNATRDLDAN